MNKNTPRKDTNRNEANKKMINIFFEEENLDYDDNSNLNTNFNSMYKMVDVNMKMHIFNHYNSYSEGKNSVYIELNSEFSWDYVWVWGGLTTSYD